MFAPSFSPADQQVAIPTTRGNPASQQGTRVAHFWQPPDTTTTSSYKHVTHKQNRALLKVAWLTLTRVLADGVWRDFIARTIAERSLVNSTSLYDSLALSSSALLCSLTDILIVVIQSFNLRPFFYLLFPFSPIQHSVNYQDLLFSLTFINF